VRYRTRKFSRRLSEGTVRRNFVIVGYIPRLGVLGKVGSLLLALRDEAGAFHFAGTVRKGFPGMTRVRLGHRLERAHVDAAPVAQAPWLGNLERWARPELVAEIEFFHDIGGQGRSRNPSFRCLRTDKTPHDCVHDAGAAGGPCLPASKALLFELPAFGSLY
jgi:ATP-dependent DNA ligase